MQCVSVHPNHLVVFEKKNFFFFLSYSLNVSRLIARTFSTPQFSYSGSEGVPVHVVQLTFLQLLSATAKQTFTYHCLNSAAWLHTATHGHEHALRFRGSDGEELTHENTHYMRPLYDGCQVSQRLPLAVSRLVIFGFTTMRPFVFPRCRHVLGRRGPCWRSTLRCPTASPCWTSPSLILERGTRSLVSKLAQCVSTVSQATPQYATVLQ